MAREKIEKQKRAGKPEDYLEMSNVEHGCEGCETSRQSIGVETGTRLV